MPCSNCDNSILPSSVLNIYSLCVVDCIAVTRCGRAYVTIQCRAYKPLHTETRSVQRRHTSHCFMHGIIVERVFCLVHGLYGVWCVIQGWDVGTLGNTLSGCITQYPRVGPSELGLCYLPYSPCSLGRTFDLSSLQSGVVFHS